MLWVMWTLKGSEILGVNEIVSNEKCSSQGQTLRQGCDCQEFIREASLGSVIRGGEVTQGERKLKVHDR